jgi:hypothetical protein
MLLEVKGNGVALIDFDNDGDSDVFVPNGATLRRPGRGPGSRLFENEGGMRFRDITLQAGINFKSWAYGAAMGDINADGFDDLFVTCYGQNAILQNNGSGQFVNTTAQSGIRGREWSTGCSFGDIDNDGDLDLYVVNYAVLKASEVPAPTANFLGATVMKGPMGLPAVPDVLYENQGDGTFRDISEQSGIHQVAPSYGLGAVILDFDGDHIQDIFVGNDSEASFLFKGRGDGTFEEIGLASGVALSGGGAGQATMGIALGDVNSNGLPDLFTTNFMFDTNTLHANLGNGIFEDQTAKYGLDLDGRPYLSWATSFFDFDHDTDEDLIFFNGHIYPEATCSARGWDYRQPPVLYERTENRFLRQSSQTAGAWLAEEHSDRSAAFGDLDSDGDIDLVICERNGPVRLLRNDRDGGNWLQVQINDFRPGHDRHGYGSRIEVIANGKSQYRWIASGVGFLAANRPVAHFGLGKHSGPVSIIVTLPDGQTIRSESSCCILKSIQIP